MSTHYLKLGDRQPTFDATLENSDGTGADLTGASTIRLRVRRPESGALVIDSTAPAVVSAAAGTVRYAPSAGDVTALQTDMGTLGAMTYLLEWTVTFSVGEATWPQPGYDRLLVVARLG